MTPQQLEALVLAAVERAKKGQPIEDDRIEMKRDWPPSSKARQLAGSCNRSSGEWLIYIIGVDEASGTIHALTRQDPADWWAQMSSRFEGVSPEVVMHLNVPVDSNETVVSILFRTDRAPYVVKVDGGGSPELEVPIRDTTRTRSARRDELLRLLVPSSGVPTLVLLNAELTAELLEAEGSAPERVRFYGQARFYLEGGSGTTVLLPEHQMRLILRSGSHEIEAEVDFFRARYNASPAPAFGVHVSADGVVVSGPGAFRMDFGAKVDTTIAAPLVSADPLEILLEASVAGSGRKARTTGILSKAGIDRGYVAEPEDLAHWEFR